VRPVRSPIVEGRPVPDSAGRRPRTDRRIGIMTTSLVYDNSVRIGYARVSTRAGNSRPSSTRSRLRTAGRSSPGPPATEPSTQLHLLTGATHRC